MRVALHGRIDAPAITVIGTWDPLLTPHHELFDDLVRRARATRRCAVVIMLDPDPVSYLWGPADRPSYHDWRVRVHEMRAAGVDAVVRIHFRRADVDAVAADLFRAIAPRISLAELWLGARQSFGRGPGGNGAAIDAQAERFGFTVYRLPPAKRATVEGNVIRRLMIAGQVRQAAGLVGRSPVRARPTSGHTTLAWAAGTYQALVLDTPSRVHDPTPITVRLLPRRNRLADLVWPDPAVPYLAIIAGPGDQFVAAPWWGKEERIAS